MWFDTYQLNFAVGPQADITDGLAEVDSVYGAGFIVRKSIFKALDAIEFESLLSDRKGNQLMSGGDTEICMISRYIGYKIYYNPNMLFKHLMPAGRMQWEYLKKLHYGFGRTRVYIRAYTIHENETAIAGINNRLPLWLDRYLHVLKELMGFPVSLLFKGREEGNKDVLKYLALRGELHELRTLKDNYKTALEKILLLNQRIAAFKNKK